MGKNILGIEPREIENAVTVLSQLKDDEKVQRCLSIYKSLPDDKQDILLVAMDAFVMGAEAAGKAAKKNYRKEANR